MTDNGAQPNSVAIRWIDTDGLGHVNHATFLTYFEEARSPWLQGHGISVDNYVVARCSIQYHQNVHLSDRHVCVSFEIDRLGNKSLTTNETMAVVSGQIVAEAQFVLVLWDPVARQSRTMSGTERASLTSEKSRMKRDSPRGLTPSQRGTE